MGLTSVGPPEVIKFCRKHYPDVDMIKPKISIYNQARKEGMLPARLIRWCCRVYKEGIGACNVVLIGIRHAESRQRSGRSEVEITSHKYSGSLEGLDERTIGCIRGYESLLISPIIEWTDDEVWLFLNTPGIKHCKLYDKGYYRIGCLCCPMHDYKQKPADCKRHPHIYNSWIKAIKDIQAGGMMIDGGLSPEEVFDYWIYGKSINVWREHRRQQMLNF